VATSVTLATARQELAKRASEFLQGTATGGSTTTVVDANNLQYADDYWDEQMLLFTSGTNNGLTRRVQTFTKSSFQATLYSAATASVMSGDTYELYRRFSPNDHKTALNAAINKSWPSFYQDRSTAVVTATQDTLQYGFPTGPDIGDKGLIAIEYQNWTLPTQTTFPYAVLAPDEYDVRKNWDTVANARLRTLQLRFNPATNRLIRFVFGAPLPKVSVDTDYINLGDPELEWLYAQAKAELWRLESNRSESVARKDAMQMLTVSQQEADGLRKDLAMAWPPKPIRRTRFYVS
jgi:hypothetical protein